MASISAALLLFFVTTLLLLAPGGVVGQHRVNPSQLLSLNGSVSQHLTRITVANYSLTTFFGTDDGTRPDGHSGPDDGIDTNAQFLSTAVAVFCAGKAARCQFSNATNTSYSYLSDPDNIIFLNGSFLQNLTSNTVTFSAGFVLRIPPEATQVDPSVPHAQFLLAETLVAALDEQFARTCSGQGRARVSYVKYETVSGSVQRTGACVTTPPPTIPSTTSIVPTASTTTTTTALPISSASPSNSVPAQGTQAPPPASAAPTDSAMSPSPASSEPGPTLTMEPAASEGTSAGDGASASSTASTTRSTSSSAGYSVHSGPVAVLSVALAAAFLSWLL